MKRKNRIHITLPADLLRELQELAVKRERTLSNLIARLLKKTLKGE